MKSLLFTAMFALVAHSSCEPTKAPKPADTSTGQPAPTESTSAQPIKKEPLELSKMAVHKVKLPYTHKIQGAKGQVTEYNEAWLVVFDLKNLGSPTDLGLNFFIGDYQIPEYGGAPNGIYFRIYEEKALRSLQENEISFQVQGGPKTPLNQKFMLPELEKLSIEDETAVIKGSKQ